MCESVCRNEESSLPTGATGVTREKGTSSSDLSVYRSSTEEPVKHKGSKASTLNKGSEEYFEYSCNPCNIAEDYVMAQGYCINCNEYLCGPCIKGHSRNRSSRHHTLRHNENVPKKSQLCGPCEGVGDEEEAVGYCSDCGEYLCSSCFRSHSRNKASRQHVLLDKDNMPKHTEEYTYIRDIYIKANGDEKDCYVTGMTLVTSHELILADFVNKSLKLVDLENNRIIDRLGFQAPPVGLTKISHDKLAVVLFHESKIQIISVSEGLSVVHTLNTSGICLGIKFMNEKLYVSFSETLKFQILQLTGAVYMTINPDSEVLKHCTFPRYIAVSQDERRIYISDWKTNRVMCMDMNGKLMSMYQGELKQPQDISISPFGAVYLCNRDQQVMYKMTSDLSEATEILGRGDGLFAPHAMCFNADKQHLYVIGTGSTKDKYCNLIKLYSWK